MDNEKLEMMAACIVVFCMVGTVVLLVGVLALRISQLFHLFQ